MILKTIHDIINGNLQPWRRDNVISDNIYRERLASISDENIPEGVNYRINYRQELLFTNRVRYYCRIVHNETTRHLTDMFSILSQDNCGELTSYHLKMTREAIATLVHDAVERSKQYQIDINTLTQANADFLKERTEKEYTLILRFIVASLCQCYMEVTKRFSEAVNPIDKYDVATFYTSVVGWGGDTLFQVVPNDNNQSRQSLPKKTANKKPKRISHNSFTKETFTLNTFLNEDERIAEKRMSLFCESLFTDFVNTVDNTKKQERRKIESLFTGKQLPEKEKIIWKGHTNELVYFFRKLAPFLSHSSRVGIWDIVASHFKVNYQGKRNVRVVPITASSLKSTSGKPQRDIMEKLDSLVKLLTASSNELLQQLSDSMKENPEDEQYKSMSEKAYAKELNSSDQRWK